MNAPSLGRRLACNLYEALLVLSLLILVLFPFAAITHGLEPHTGAIVQWFFLALVSGIYFTVFWQKGQTLAMKTWRIRIESAEGGQPSAAQAWLRFVLACLNLLLLGAGWWGALFRTDRQFLQDHFAGTRLLRH